MLRLGTTVLGVRDIRRAADFWMAALDLKVRDDWDDMFVVLVPESGHGAALALMPSDSSAERRPRVHLDLYADDPKAEIARLLSIGARTVDWDSYPEDADFTVLADPSDNIFCVIDKS